MFLDHRCRILLLFFLLLHMGLLVSVDLPPSPPPLSPSLSRLFLDVPPSPPPLSPPLSIGGWPSPSLSIGGWPSPLEDGLLLPCDLWEDAWLDFPEPSCGGVGREPKVDGEVGEEVMPQLNPDNIQVSGVTFDTNSGAVEEINPPRFSPPARQENPDEDFVNGEVEPVGIGSEGTEEALSPGPSGKRKRKEKTRRGERGNKKTSRVRNVITLENILQVKEMLLKGAAELLKVSRYALKRACREHGINRWPPRAKHEGITQSLPDETPAVVDQEGILQLTFETLPSDQALTTTVDTNSVAEEIAQQPFSLPVRQENPDEDSGNDEVEVVGMGSMGTGKGEMRRIEKAPGGERGKCKTIGVRIELDLKDILKYKDMRIEDAARKLNVSRSTLKRVCREHYVKRWPPREKHKLIGQSRPNKSLAVVDQERNPQLNSSALLPSNEESASVDTNGVTVKARYEGQTFKFKLSKRPWGMAELEEQVKKRLKLEAQIKYKDEDGELISIVCDDDLQHYILTSRSQGTTSIVVLLEQKGSR